MNKIFSIILILILAFSRLFSGIDYGFKLGMSAAEQTFEYSEVGIDVDFEYRYGYYSGIFIEYPVFKYVALISEIYYTQRGMLAEVVGTVIADNELGYKEKIYKYDNRVDYLGLSFCSKFRHSINFIQPYILTGIKYEFLIDKKTSAVFDDVYSRYEGNVLGLLAGIGTEINNILPFTLFLEGVYDYDITKVKISETFKIDNSSYEIKIGVKF